MCEKLDRAVRTSACCSPCWEWMCIHVESPMHAFFCLIDLEATTTPSKSLIINHCHGLVHLLSCSASRSCSACSSAASSAASSSSSSSSWTSFSESACMSTDKAMSVNDVDLSRVCDRICRWADRSRQPSCKSWIDGVLPHSSVASAF